MNEAAAPVPDVGLLGAFSDRGLAHAFAGYGD